MSTSATPEPIIRQIVDAMRTLAGPHPGRLKARSDIIFVAAAKAA